MTPIQNEEGKWYVEKYPKWVFDTEEQLLAFIAKLNAPIAPRERRQ